MNNIKNDKKPEHLKVGILGEDIACKYLLGKGYQIVERNYTKKWGEIDVIAGKAGKLFFIEVKSVSSNFEHISHETIDRYKPEDNAHPQKLKRMARTVQTYLAQKGNSYLPGFATKTGETDWQVDILAVFIDMEKRLARVRVTENVII